MPVRGYAGGMELCDLKARLVAFAVRILRVAKALPESVEGRHICGQIVRSGTSPAPNYAEAQDAESASDFVHKLKIVLKELRETEVWLEVIVQSGLLAKDQIEPLLKESDELISIFVASVNTAKKKIKRR